jgi:peptidoglycan/xylan/chitin deacetylase (PgdA/CDA1 family)
MGFAAVMRSTGTLAGQGGPSPSTTPASQRLLAVTVDDLPGFGRLASGDNRASANLRLLSAFTKRGLHATGFVVCGNAQQQDAVLQAWLANGMELGNHTAHHLDLHRTPPEKWVADVQECHERLSQIVGGRVRYFRYPGLHQGESVEQRNAASSILAQLGYTNAHVTVDNSDWLLADAYGRALVANDMPRRDLIARAYLEHILSAVRHFDGVGQAEFGRRPPHVLLLHANALAADHAGTLLDELLASGVRIVPLSEVLADPVFASTDIYSGPKGLSWFYRIRPGAFDRWGSWDDVEAQRILTNFLSIG